MGGSFYPDFFLSNFDKPIVIDYNLLMCIEKGAVSPGRKTERPERVVCSDCGRGYKLLHWTHLRVHGYDSQADYRKSHGIDVKVPLNSQEYAESRREVQQQPDKRERTLLMIKSWQLQRRIAFALLERQDFYTPRRVSEITQIPVQTIHSAIKRHALPCGQVGLLVETDKGLVPVGNVVVKGVTLEDMVKFTQVHKQKYSAKR